MQNNNFLSADIVAKVAKKLKFVKCYKMPVSKHDKIIEQDENRNRKRIIARDKDKKRPILVGNF